jgi:hypothetical protein
LKVLSLVPSADHYQKDGRRLDVLHHCLVVSFDSPQWSQ